MNPGRMTLRREAIVVCVRVRRGEKNVKKNVGLGLRVSSKRSERDKRGMKPVLLFTL